MNFVTATWDIIWEALGWFQICTFVDEWEEGVLLRRGKFVRTFKAGITWHWPFIDELHVMNVKPDAMELDEQVLTTQDDYKVAMKVVLMWSIFDIRACTIDVEDAAETLQQIAVGYVHDRVEVTDFDDIRIKSFRSELKRDIQKQARKFGITVSQVKIQDFAETKVFRLIS